MYRPVPRGPRGSTILEATLVLVMLGLLSAIAVPRFLSARARAHQAEVRSNLKAWHLAQRSFYEENARYTQEPLELDFTIPRGNRYAYYFQIPVKCELRDTAVAVSPPLDPWGRGMNCIAVDRYVHGGNTPALPPVPSLDVGITHTGAGLAPGNPGVTRGPKGWSREGNVSAVAVGQLDDDLFGVDAWYISSADASVSLQCGDSKEHLEAGTPINIYDDVLHDNC